MKKNKGKLSASMTEDEFDRGYWYALKIKKFATCLGIPAANRLRKDELEEAIKVFLRTGKITKPTKRNLSNSGIKDSDRGLSLKLPVVNYTNNPETKNFIVKEARKVVPSLREKSGVRYRLNRWREDQLTKGIKITYGDLVKHYVELNQTEGKFAQVTVGRYINFLSYFLSAKKAATREQAIKAWKELKALNVPKNYLAWAKHKRRKELEPC